MTWFVSYRTSDGQKSREGPDRHATEDGFTVIEVVPVPVIWDALTGSRRMDWSPVTLTYEPI